MSDGGIDSRAATARHWEKVIVVHYCRWENRISVVDAVWQMHAVSPEVTDLEDRLAGKLVLNIYIPLLYIAAAGIVLNQAIPQVISGEQGITTFWEGSWCQVRYTALLEKWRRKNTNAFK